MKYLWVIFAVVLVGCVKPNAQVQLKKKSCIKKCKHSFLIGSRYQQGQRRIRCIHRCQSRQE